MSRKAELESRIWEEISRPAKDIDITSTGNNFYTVSARGNTNYYNYDGISSVQLFVRFNPNK